MKTASPASRAVCTRKLLPCLIISLAVGCSLPRGGGKANSLIEVEVSGDFEQTYESRSQTGGTRWSVEKTGQDLFLEIDDRFVLMTKVVGPGSMRYVQITRDDGAPDFVFYFADGTLASWKGSTIQLAGEDHELAAPGTYTFERNGKMTFRASTP